jgi:GTPase
VTAPAANGRVLAYLGAHAEIYRQTYDGDQVVVRCFIPKHLVHHIQAPGVTVKALATEVWDERAAGRAINGSV